MQRTQFFNDTVRRNMGLLHIVSEEEMDTVAECLDLYDEIHTLEMVWDTEIKIDPCNFSEGQMRRLDIMRNILKNSQILIFDEATSALDYESERIIQQNMASICKGRTVFMIAHRLSTVRECDQIITIEKGEITETGTHEELLKRGGRYAYLWNSQTAPIVPNEVAAE